MAADTPQAASPAPPVRPAPTTPAPPSHPPVTVMMHAAAEGDAAAAAQILPLVYAELRRLARDRMRRLAPGNTLQPTALVHEAYLRLLGSEQAAGGQAVTWKSRGHFFGAAAQAMRDILVEQARRKAAIKHGGGLQRVEGVEGKDDDAAVIAIEEPVEDLMDLDQALGKLEAEDLACEKRETGAGSVRPGRAQIVMLRYFAGLTAAETAAALDVSERTIAREWRFIKAWLRHEMEQIRRQRSGCGMAGHGTA